QAALLVRDDTDLAFVVYPEADTVGCQSAVRLDRVGVGDAPAIIDEDGGGDAGDLAIVRDRGGATADLDARAAGGARDDAVRAVRDHATGAEVDAAPQASADLPVVRDRTGGILDVDAHTAIGGLDDTARLVRDAATIEEENTGAEQPADRAAVRHGAGATVDRDRHSVETGLDETACLVRDAAAAVKIDGVQSLAGSLDRAAVGDGAGATGLESAELTRDHP